MAPDTLHVALAFDERFWAPAFATMRGICLTTRRRSDLIFHLCHPTLSAGALADLAKIRDEFPVTLVHHDISADANYRHFATTLPHSKYISEVMYARLLLDRIVDPAVSRIAYVDCDILVRAPIEGLLAQPLDGKPLGAAQDAHSLVSSNRRDINQDRDLFDPADAYFNSGILVIDLDAWRKMDIVATLYRLEQDGVLGRLPNDQQVLNYLFKHNWTQIDPSWNTFAANTAIEIFNPKIVHYTGLAKPWNLVPPVPFRRVYRHVMTNAVFYRYMRERWKRYWLGLVGVKL